jgi:hypothetical protein
MTIFPFTDPNFTKIPRPGQQVNDENGLESLLLALRETFEALPVLDSLEEPFLVQKALQGDS